MFLKNQPEASQEKYFELLKAFGSLSRLFSENDVPYLYYRAHENIFCKALEASNESRGDVAIDAVKDFTGIGLKTFIYKNSQFEKIAEFNRSMPSYSGLSDKELAKEIARLRNERINITKRLYDLESNIYHCVARDQKKFIVYEVNMPPIKIDDIGNVRDDGRMVHFSDGIQEYKFNRSKSTLFKKFNPVEKYEFAVDVIKDPYEAILELFGTEEKVEPDSNFIKSIVLPLYSTRGGENYVPEKSGLNQWNAGGRSRADNEVYIPVPAWIHQVFEGFFPPRDEPFNLKLPSGKTLSVKVCQDNSKALMSNPNSDLGEWLLRGVLDLKPGELLTYERLEEVGIDSVSISKNRDETYDIDFKTQGTYEQFRIDYKTS